MVKIILISLIFIVSDKLEQQIEFEKEKNHVTSRNQKCDQFFSPLIAIMLTFMFYPQTCDFFMSAVSRGDIFAAESKLNQLKVTATVSISTSQATLSSSLLQFLFHISIQ